MYSLVASNTWNPPMVSGRRDFKKLEPVADGLRPAGRTRDRYPRTASDRSLSRIRTRPVSLGQIRRSGDLELGRHGFEHANPAHAIASLAGCLGNLRTSTFRRRRPLPGLFPTSPERYLLRFFPAKSTPVFRPGFDQNPCAMIRLGCRARISAADRCPTGCPAIASLISTQARSSVLVRALP